MMNLNGSSNTLRILLAASGMLALVACNAGGKDTGDDTIEVSEDTTAPVITLEGDAEISLEYGDTFTDPGATATDDVDGEVEVVVSGSVDTGVLGSYTLSYDATDSAGNAAETVTRTVNVVDTTAPVIVLKGDDPLIIEEGGVFTDPGVTITDNVDTDLTAVVTGSVDTSTAGVYTLTYDATDSSGNAAASVSRTVEVVFTGDLFVAASGSELVLVGLAADGSLGERGTAAIDFGEATYNTNHVIFGLAKDPGSNTIYATSFNECGAYPLDTDGCWGNGRIDRFTYDVNGIVYDGPALIFQLPLRMLEPDYDAKTGALTLTLMNQGTDDIEVTSVTVGSLPKGVADSAGCDGVTLKPGDTCDLDYTGFTSTPNLYPEVVTDVGTFDNYLYFDADLGYRAYGLEQNSGFDETVMPWCVNNSWEPNQYGGCAPTALAISSDGTRVFVNDDYEDNALTFSLDGDGNMTYLGQSDTYAYYQGIDVNEAGTVVYNGSRAYAFAKDTLTTSKSDTGEYGNATQVFRYDGDEMLATAVYNNYFAIYSLVDPLAPSKVAEYEPVDDGVRFQHHSADGSRFVVQDFYYLSLIEFDGKSLTELDVYDITVDIDCKSCSFDAYNRSVQMTPGGDFAVVSAFVNAYDEQSLKKLPFLGQLASYSVDPKTGEVAEADTLPLPGMSRIVMLVPPM